MARKKTRGINSYNAWIAKHHQHDDITWVYQYNYARSGLKLGLQQQSTLGANPFKFGLIGSTDSHTALATADEANFWGFSPMAYASP